MIASHDGTTIVPAPAPVPLTPRHRPRLRHRSLWGEIWRWSLTALLFTFIAAAIAGAFLIGAIYRQARIDGARPVEAIVVLGTAQYNGAPGPVFRARLDRALTLWDEGYAPLLVVTGGKMPGDGYTEAEAAWTYLTEAGVPPAAIISENAAGDTWESMQGVAALLAPLGVDEVIVVSDGFHLFRSRLMARDVGLRTWGSPAAESPIRTGGGGELTYILREAAAVAAHLWQTRVGSPAGFLASPSDA
ncbi:MAG: YdcF family protein [Chloroflexia bacterium]|nr:YdcF family protein [Chloroflexia bacterium]